MNRPVVPAVLLVPVLALAACGGGGDASFCELAEEFERSDLSGDPGTLEERVEQALIALDRLVESAPDEVVTDVITVRDAVEEFARGTGRLGPTFEEASRRVSAYIGRECTTP